jgi:hypothetical protein
MNGPSGGSNRLQIVAHVLIYSVIKRGRPPAILRTAVDRAFFDKELDDIQMPTEGSAMQRCPLIIVTLVQVDAKNLKSVKLIYVSIHGTDTGSCDG